MLTAAGEGLDVIIATEHNRVDDYTPAVTRKNLDRWTVTIPGNEVTTPMGHFNIFPTRPGAAQPDPLEKDWAKLMRTLKETEGVQVVVQNHPRDLHSNYRPFDPSHHLSSSGVNLRNRPVLANAMEVVNSGAMSSDPLQLVRDWMGLLTRGLAIAAVGASDTHTVDFVPIGQARTYIDTKGLAANWRKEQTFVCGASRRPQSRQLRTCSGITSRGSCRKGQASHRTSGHHRTRTFMEFRRSCGDLQQRSAHMGGLDGSE